MTFLLNIKTWPKSFVPARLMSRAANAERTARQRWAMPGSSHDKFVALCPGWFLTPDLILMWTSVVLTLCALVFYVNQGVQVAKKMGLIKQRT